MTVIAHIKYLPYFSLIMYTPKNRIVFERTELYVEMIYKFSITQFGRDAIENLKNL